MLTPYRTRLARIALGPALLLVLAGCADDRAEPAAGTAVQTEQGDTTGESVPSSDAPVHLEPPVNDTGVGTVEDGIIEITATDSFAFDPTYIQAEPGSDVAIRLVNDSNEEHTFVVDEQGIDVALDPQGDDQAAGIVMPDEGHLRFHCSIHGFEGMVGAFYAGEP